MLTITVVLSEGLDERTNEFVTVESAILKLEHSLFSLSKWESFYKKPFLNEEKKTSEEAMAYFKCMTLTPDVPDEVFNKLSQKNVDEINEYMNATVTATWFSKSVKKGPQRETITAEIIYYWMVGVGLPFECQYWHLDRLLTQIRVINEKNEPDKKKRRFSSSAAQERRELNARRKAEMGTSG